MAEDRIDSFIDQQAIEAEKKLMLEALDQLLAKINQFADVKISFSGAKDLGQLTDAQKRLTKGHTELSLATKEYEKTVNAVVTTQAKLNAGTSEAAQNLANLKLQQQQQNKELRDQAKLQQAAADSTTAMRIELEKLQLQFDNLSKADKRSAVGNDLLNRIVQLDAAVKEEEAITGRFRRNVGNYQGSAAIIVQALEKTRQKFNDLNRDSRSSPEQISRVKQELDGLERIVSQPNFLNISAKFGDANAELKFFTKSLIDLEQSGLGNSEAANQLRQQLARLTDEIRDTREEVRALSSDTRQFDLFAGAVTTMVNTVQVAAGVQALFGKENEDVARSIQKLVALQNVANGVQQIAEQLTRKGTAANKAYAFVMAQIEVLTSASTSATAKFSSALKLGIIGAVAVGIFELAKAVGLFGNNSEKTAGQVKFLHSQIEALGTANTKAINDLKFGNDLLLADLKKRGASEKEINDATVGGLRKQATSYRELAREQLDQIQASTGLNLENIRTLKDASTALDQLKVKQAENERLISEGGVLKKFAKKQKEAIDGAVQLGDAIVQNFQKATEADRQATVTSAQFDAQATQDSIDRARRAASEKAKIELELFKFRVKLAADSQAAIGGIEAFSIANRKSALTVELELRKSIVEKQRQFDLDEVTRARATAAQKHELTGDLEESFQKQRVLINERANNDILQLEKDLSIKLLIIRQQQIDAEKEMIKESIEQFTAADQARLEKAAGKLSDEFAQRQLTIERFRQEDRASVVKSFEEGLITKKEFVRKIQDIDEGAHKATLENDVIFYTEQLRRAREAGINVLQAEQDLANAKEALSDLIIQKQLDAIGTTEELLQTLNDRYIELGHTIATTFSAIIGGAFDAQKNRIQDQMDAIDELKAREIDRINATTAASEEKAARIKIVESKAQADKEALERKQREIDRRKALFERAFSAFTITASGIETVAKIKVTVAEIAALQAKAIASGNPLLIAAASSALAAASAQIPIAIATTAAQLISLLAQPLPKFAHGVTDAQPGVGIWGEVGQEMKVDRRGRLEISPNRPSLVHLMGGETIFPHDVTRNILKALSMEHMMGHGGVQIDLSGLGTEEVVEQLKQLNDKPIGINLYSQLGIEHSAEYIRNMKQ